MEPPVSCDLAALVSPGLLLTVEGFRYSLHCWLRYHQCKQSGSTFKWRGPRWRPAKTEAKNILMKWYQNRPPQHFSMALVVLVKNLVRVGGHSKAEAARRSLLCVGFLLPSSMRLAAYYQRTPLWGLPRGLIDLAYATAFVMEWLYLAGGVRACGPGHLVPIQGASLVSAMLALSAALKPHCFEARLMMAIVCTTQGLWILTQVGSSMHPSQFHQQYYYQRASLCLFASFTFHLLVGLVSHHWSDVAQRKEDDHSLT